jgi:hypothetical protein
MMELGVVTRPRDLAFPSELAHRRAKQLRSGVAVMQREFYILQSAPRANLGNLNDIAEARRLERIFGPTITLKVFAGYPMAQ